MEDVELNLPNKRMPNIVNFSFKTKKASVIVEALSNKQIYVSSLSACHSKSSKESHVLKAMGKTSTLAENSIRVSFSSYNTIQEIDIFIDELTKIIRSIK